MEKGSELNLFDYKSNRWNAHKFEDTLLTRVGCNDECGENLLLYNMRKAYTYDIRQKNLIFFEDFGLKEKYFYNLIYNAFRVGEYLAFVTSYKTHLYDIRFPKDCVANYYHLSEIPPERNSNTRDYFEDSISNLNTEKLNQASWQDIEAMLLDTNPVLEQESQSLTNSCC